MFEALFGCHDVLILGKSPIKLRHRPDMTMAVDFDVKHRHSVNLKCLYFTAVMRILILYVSHDPTEEH